MRPIRVLFAGHDHGGINILLALMRGWSGNPDITAELLCPPVMRRDIVQQWPQLVFAPVSPALTQQMSSRRDDLDRCLPEVLATGRYDAVICGTSAHALLERRLIVASRQAGIPSVAFCDMWWAYAERFRDGNDWTLPDRLWVIDDTMAEAASRVAWPVRLPIDVVGSPLFGELARKRQERSWRGNSIRFISEPAATEFPEARIDEFALAEMLVSTARQNGVNLPIVIRPHPVDSQESWRRWTFARRSLDVRLDDMPLEAAIADTARAIGISSILLTEMRMCGVAAASLQPSGTDPNYYCLPFEELGIARLTDEGMLAHWLLDVSEAAPPKAQALHLDAVSRATRLITQMVGEPAISSLAVSR